MFYWCIYIHTNRLSPATARKFKTLPALQRWVEAKGEEIKVLDITGSVTASGGNRKKITKEQLVARFEAAHPELDLKTWVTNVIGHKCCETWTRDELVDEFGYGYCFYMQDLRNKRNAEVRE